MIVKVRIQKKNPDLDSEFSFPDTKRIDDMVHIKDGICDQMDQNL